MRMTAKLAINLVTVLVLFVVTVGWVVSNVLGNGIMNPPFTVTADFAASGGVYTNQEVTYRGVVIGKVGALELNEGVSGDEPGVDVELLIDEEWEGRIPENVMARVQNKSAVGEQFVNLTPISAGGGMLEDGDEIARENTELPVDFQALLRSLDTVLADIPPDQVNRLVTNLASGIGGRGDDLASILRSLRDLSTAFAKAAPEQQRLLDNATVAGSEFLRTKDEFTAAMQASDDVLEGLGDEPEELAAFFRANDRIAREGSALLARHGGNLKDGIAGLADLVEFQNDNKDDVIQSLEYVPQFLHAVEDSAIRWENPDGREFWRIRVGLVYDNVQSTWPCEYENPLEYERFPHVREVRNPDTRMKCLPPDEESTKRVRALISELKAWAREHRGEIDAARPVSDSVRAGIEAAMNIPLGPILVTPSPTPTPEPTSTAEATPSSTP
jgi:virulence factor Mce-like protein